MDQRRKLGIGLLALLGVLLGAALLATCGPAQPFGGMMGGGRRSVGRTFASNGERIYFTATSQRGTPITFDMDNSVVGSMPMMTSGALACADCHGPDGRGGRQQMMMTSFTAPDIRWQTLAADDHGGAENHGDEAAEMEHPPYTSETLKRAITQGVDPAGDPLASPMPRWRMSDEDLNDLIAYLQTLE
jgi:cytochrome c553